MTDMPKLVEAVEDLGQAFLRAADALRDFDVPDVALHPDDIEVSPVWVQGDPAHHSSPRGIRIVHHPMRVVVESVDAVSGLENKHRALLMLQAELRRRSE